MKDIQDMIILEHQRTINHLEKALEKLEKARYNEDFEAAKCELIFNIRVEQARAEGYITGKIRAAQKEPLSIKL